MVAAIGLWGGVPRPVSPEEVIAVTLVVPEVPPDDREERGELLSYFEDFNEMSSFPSSQTPQQFPPPHPVKTPGAPKAVPAASSAPAVEVSRGFFVQQSYGEAVAAHLAGFRFYPAAARQRGQAGRLMLRVEIDQKGGLVSGRIEKSSGFPLLDAAALRTLERASPYPPPPAGQTALLVPLRYALHED